MFNKCSERIVTIDRENETLIHLFQCTASFVLCPLSTCVQWSLCPNFYLSLSATMHHRRIRPVYPVHTNLRTPTDPGSGYEFGSGWLAVVAGYANSDYEALSPPESQISGPAAVALSSCQVESEPIKIFVLTVCTFIATRITQVPSRPSLPPDAQVAE